jgi:hypothetical protein
VVFALALKCHPRGEKKTTAEESMSNARGHFLFLFVPGTGISSKKTK